MGTDPIESQIPVEIEDFPDTVQTAFNIYYLLQDSWDSMGGNYLGKNFNGLFDYFKLFEIDSSEQLLIVSFMQKMDSIRAKLVSEKIKQQRKASSREKA